MEVSMRGRTRRTLVLVAAAIAGAAGVGLAGGGPECGDRFVVHEWGTFTSMQGADGVALEGLSREEESLPSFVYSRTEVRDCPLRDKGWKGLEVAPTHVTQKMETPVIYFHSQTPRKVRVRVDFLRGLLTQWYPVSDLLAPAEAACGAGPLDISKVERSFLQWDVDVLARGAERPAEVPSAPADDPWTFAREVDANWIRTLPRKAPDRAGPVEAERYLFYRGLGSFPMPLSAAAERGGKLTLKNSGDVAIPFAMAYEVKGGRGRIAGATSVPVRGEAQLSYVDPDDWVPGARVTEKLGAAVEDVLRKHGLAADEARAMVRTWSRSWFTCEGTRVIWIVPRATTDALLPLSIDPKPDDLVRVLVGRLEIITPEAEDEDHAALADAASGDAARAKRGAEVLERRGRFAEPHVRRVLGAIDARKAASRADDAVVRAAAEAWLQANARGGSEEPFPR
jgi:hypothetical protein